MNKLELNQTMKQLLSDINYYDDKIQIYTRLYNKVVREINDCEKSILFKVDLENEIDNEKAKLDILTERVRSLYI